MLQAVSAAAVTDTNIPEAPFISTSPGFTSLMGYKSHEVLRISNLCLCGPNTNKAAKQKVISAHYHSKPCEVQILWYKKDGAPVWVYIYCCPMVPPDAIQARPCHHLNILLDVTSTRPSRIGKHIMGRVIGSGASGIVRIGKSIISGTPSYPYWLKLFVNLYGKLYLRKCSTGKFGLTYLVHCCLVCRTCPAQSPNVDAVLPCSALTIEKKLLLDGSIRLQTSDLICFADEIVAIKIIDCGKFRSISEIEQIQDEISVLSTLKHPNIIRLLDVHFLDSVFYFIMEFASGGPLVSFELTRIFFIHSVYHSPQEKASVQFMRNVHF